MNVVDYVVALLVAIFGCIKRDKIIGWLRRQCDTLDEWAFS